MLDVLVQSGMRKDHKDEEKIMSNKVEDATGEELKKEVKIEMNQIDEVEGQVLELLSCCNARTLEKEERISKIKEEMKEELNNEEEELKKK